MIISVHQPQYLPWLGYFHKMQHSDAFVFLDNVQYKKREYQNRNRIKTKEGKMWLAVPVLNNGESYPSISSLRIDNFQRWRERHWRALSLNYARAPFFKDYSPFFEDVYKGEWEKLVDLNICLIKYMMGALGVEKPLYLESKLGIRSEKTMRIIDICRALKADTYLSGIGGKDYLAEEQFNSSGIKLVYQDFRHPQYPQCHGPFIPYLSTVDLLFNCGRDSLRILGR